MATGDRQAIRGVHMRGQAACVLSTEAQWNERCGVWPCGLKFLTSKLCREKGRGVATHRRPASQYTTSYPLNGMCVCMYVCIYVYIYIYG